MEIIRLTEQVIEYLSISSLLLLILGLVSYLSVKSLKAQGKAKLCVFTLIVVLPLAYPLKTLFPESVIIPVPLEVTSFQNHEGNAAEKTVSTIASLFSNNPDSAAKTKESESGPILSKPPSPGTGDWLIGTISGTVRNWRLIATIVWGGVFFFFLFRITSTVYKTNKFMRIADPVTNPEIVRVLQQCAADTGLRSSPKLLMVEGISTPMLMGFITPGIIIPGHLLRPEFREGLRFALLHELKHLQQHHNWWLLVESIIGAAYFFHPVFHWAKRKIHEELENICDSHVIRVTKKSVSYADFLLNQIWQQNSGRNPALALPFVSSVSKTTTRIHSILKNTGPSALTHMRDRISVFFILLAFPSILLLSIAPSVPNKDQGLKIIDPLNINFQADAAGKGEPARQKKDISLYEQSLSGNFENENSYIAKTVRTSQTRANTETTDKLLQEDLIIEPVPETKSQQIEVAGDGVRSETIREAASQDTMSELNVLNPFSGNNLLLAQGPSNTREMTEKSIPQATISEKYLGAPVNELTISRIDNINILDQNTILFIMKGGDIYLTRLSEPCPGLLQASDFGFDSMNGGRISKFNRIHAISYGQIVATSGMLSGFYPYLYEGNKYEAIKALKKDLLAALVTEGAFHEFKTAER